MRKHIITIASPKLMESVLEGGCGKCKVSCQSACKTSCTVGNQVCSR